MAADIGLAQQFLELDTRDFTLEHRANFFPTNAPKPNYPRDRREEFHPDGGTLQATRGLIVSHLYFIPADEQARRHRYPLRRKLEGLSELALHRVPVGFANELVEGIDNPLHRWLLIVHVASNQCLRFPLDPECSGAYESSQHDGKFPSRSGYSNMAPVGAMSALALERLELAGHRDESSADQSPSLRQASAHKEESPNRTSPQAIYLGKGRIRVGRETLSLYGQEAMVIQAIVELQSATGKELNDRSGVSDAVAVLKRIIKKFPLLTSHITFPGKRNAGGYRTTIQQSH